MPPIYLDPDDPLWDETDDDDEYREDDPSLTAEERSPSLIQRRQLHP